MTFSVVGQAGDAFGVAVASRFLAVGAVVPLARAGVGAVATQALAKVSYKHDALALLGTGGTAEDAVAQVTTEDELREHRQLGLVAGTSQATWTGAACLDWAGGTCGRDESGAFAIQGNILVGPHVVDAMVHAWHAAADQPLTCRLVASLLAGDAAGGDSRGRQAAALYAVQPGSGYDAGGVLADLRVDDHPDAPVELARLLEENDLLFGGPEDVRPLAGELANEVRECLSRLGHREVDLNGALAGWASEMNFEMRLTPDGVDSKVLACPAAPGRRRPVCGEEVRTG